MRHVCAGLRESQAPFVRPAHSRTLHSSLKQERASKRASERVSEREGGREGEREREREREREKERERGRKGGREGERESARAEEGEQGGGVLESEKPFRAPRPQLPSNCLAQGFRLQQKQRQCDKKPVGLQQRP